MKKLKPLGILLFLASKLIDLYEFSRDPFNLISSYYKINYGESKNFKANIKSVLKHALNKKYVLIKKSHLHLTKKGSQKLKNEYPSLYFTKKNWDRKLRLVIFDFQEINRFKRNQLRRLLKQLGFIMIQKSVWLSPYDQFETIKRWIKENKLQEKILLIEAKKIDFKNKDKIINQFW